MQAVLRGAVQAGEAAHEQAEPHGILPVRTQSYHIFKIMALPDAEEVASASLRKALKINFWGSTRGELTGIGGGSLSCRACAAAQGTWIRASALSTLNPPSHQMLTSDHNRDHNPLLTQRNILRRFRTHGEGRTECRKGCMCGPVHERLLREQAPAKRIGKLPLSHEAEGAGHDAEPRAPRIRQHEAALEALPCVAQDGRHLCAG